MFGSSLRYKTTTNLYEENMEYIKFILRLIKHLGVLFLVLLPLEILGWVILLPICYLQGTSLEKLPVWLKWFDNADQYVGRNIDTYRSIYLSGWYNRYVWLAWRNPLNYFGYEVLGHKVSSKMSVLQQHGDVSIGDGTKSGFYYVECKDRDEILYEYYLIHKWSDTKCLRFRMGYKIKSPDSNLVDSVIQYVLVLQPYKDFWGK